MRLAPGRRVDDSQVNAWLHTAVQTYSCHVFPEEVRILREFGGLHLAGAPEVLFVYPVFENDLFDEPELWFLWEWQIEQVLFPIAYDS